MQNPKGSIVCVGLGMSLGAHISTLTRNFIQQADIVFMGVTNALAEQWLIELNSNSISLQTFYQEGKDRRESYEQMVNAMMHEIRSGKKVVGAFYGHPGVFAWAPHKVIELAKLEGYHGHMEPGVSAEDCLYADMGIDPGTYGIAHYEASQFMRYQRVVDVAAYLVLWQIGFVGDPSCRRYQTEASHRQILIVLLLQYYPEHHSIAVYECATLPNERPTILWTPLNELAHVAVKHHSTLLIPPCITRKIDTDIQSKLNLLNKIEK